MPRKRQNGKNPKRPPAVTPSGSAFPSPPNKASGIHGSKLATIIQILQGDNSDRIMEAASGIIVDIETASKTNTCVQFLSTILATTIPGLLINLLNHADSDVAFRSYSLLSAIRHKSGNSDKIRLEKLLSTPKAISASFRLMERELDSYVAKSFSQDNKSSDLPTRIEIILTFWVSLCSAKGIAQNFIDQGLFKGNMLADSLSTLDISSKDSSLLVSCVELLDRSLFSKGYFAFETQVKFAPFLVKILLKTSHSSLRNDTYRALYHLEDSIELVNNDEDLWDEDDYKDYEDRKNRSSSQAETILNLPGFISAVSMMGPDGTIPPSPVFIMYSLLKKTLAWKRERYFQQYWDLNFKKHLSTLLPNHLFKSPSAIYSLGKTNLSQFKVMTDPFSSLSYMSFLEHGELKHFEEIPPYNIYMALFLAFDFFSDRNRYLTLYMLSLLLIDRPQFQELGFDQLIKTNWGEKLLWMIQDAVGWGRITPIEADPAVEMAITLMWTCTRCALTGPEVDRGYQEEEYSLDEYLEKVVGQCPINESPPNVLAFMKPWLESDLTDEHRIITGGKLFMQPLPSFFFGRWTHSFDAIFQVVKQHQLGIAAHKVGKTQVGDELLNAIRDPADQKATHEPQLVVVHEPQRSKNALNWQKGALSLVVTATIVIIFVFFAIARYIQW